MTKKDVKSCYSIKKMNSTSERHVEHPFTGQNTQHTHSKKSNQTKYFNFFGGVSWGIDHETMAKIRLRTIPGHGIMAVSTADVCGIATCSLSLSLSLPAKV